MSPFDGIERTFGFQLIIFSNNYDDHNEDLDSDNDDDDHNDNDDDDVDDDDADNVDGFAHMADVKAGLVAGQLTEGFHCFRLWGYPRYCNNNLDDPEDVGDVEEDYHEKATWFEIIVDSHQPPGIMLGHQAKVGFDALKFVVITKTYLTVERKELSV